MITGILIGLLIAGLVTIFNNGDNPKADNPTRLTLSVMRILGFFVVAGSGGGLIGSLF